MVEVAKHKSHRSLTRMLGQTVDANGAIGGVPIEVRFAHVWLHQKRTKSAAGDKVDNPHFYSVILVPQLSADAMQCPNYKALSDHCMEACTKDWGSFPQGGKWPIQNGNVPYAQKPKPGTTPMTPEQIAQRNKWREGSWVIEVTNYMDPGPRVAVFQNGQPVEIPAKVIGGQTLYKSGDYGYVSLCAYTFNNKTFGVNFGFEGVLFTRPGEAIGSSGPRTVGSMFAGVPVPMAGPAVAPTLAPAAPVAPAMAPPVAPVMAAPGPAYAPPPPASPAAPGYAAPPPPPAMAAPGPALPPFPGPR